MKYIKIAALGILSLAMPGYVAAQGDVYSYQDCILKATREGYIRNREDIGHIKQNCRRRFPDSAPDVLGEKLKEKALQQVELYTSRSDKGDIRGTLYNGNPDFFVTRVTLLLTPERGDSVQDFFDSEEFEVTLNIPPHETKHFTIDADKTGIDSYDFSAKLIRAWGY